MVPLPSLSPAMFRLSPEPVSSVSSYNDDISPFLSKVSQYLWLESNWESVTVVVGLLCNFPVLLWRPHETEDVRGRGWLYGREAGPLGPPHLGWQTHLWTNFCTGKKREGSRTGERLELGALLTSLGNSWRFRDINILYVFRIARAE
jgi:hypothetical protein